MRYKCSDVSVGYKRILQNRSAVMIYSEKFYLPPTENFRASNLTEHHKYET
ncbi:hypothetical protein HNR39_001074 [Glaciimonas immobilis]|uniref:Uncharacterized protein n=1 Tax=Glaciimonas immobilis TaxID=728004 RepID=A0A840RLT0_9BURK|nr:hypothetical protein [Glaciimonas immobilis]